MLFEGLVSIVLDGKLEMIVEKGGIFFGAGAVPDTDGAQAMSVFVLNHVRSVRSHQQSRRREIVDHPEGEEIKRKRDEERVKRKGTRKRGRGIGG